MPKQITLRTIKLEILDQRRFYILAIFSFFASLPLKGQESHTMFFMNTLPQSNLLNPAVQIPCKVFVGFPLLSSVHVNYSNTYFSYNNLISADANDSISLNPNYFLSKPNSKQDIFVELHISLIHFGFLYKNYYFNFSIQDKIDAGIAYPTNLFGLALQGNKKFIGKELDMSGLALFSTYYREWAFGVSRLMDENLTLGAKMKVLFGKAQVQTSQSDLALFTDNPVFYLTGTSSFKGNLSPLVADIANNGKINSLSLPPDASAVSLLLNRKNKGLALDFGVIYNLDDKITLHGSLLDVGFIRWAYAPVNLKESSNFKYAGIYYNSRLSFDQNVQNMGDSLTLSYKFSKTTQPYTSFIAPKLYMGATYELLPTVNTGLILRNELYHKKLLTSATASVNAWYRNYFAGSLSWSYINGSFANVGGGISLRTPNFGFYTIADNVYGAFKYKSARILNLRFGFNFLFGCRQCEDKKDKLAKKGCAAYRDIDAKEVRRALWIGRMQKAQKKRLRGK